ncbi:MAG: hypothetical protein KF822_10550 [Steroidobacteraceae bacterium]|nr:hypothetical protein [Steroidobacteraceae bacterium]
MIQVRRNRWPVLVLASLLAAPAALADDIRPASLREPGTARPFADERCIEQCDTKSDKCMQASNGDPDKVQACDDQYSECLAECDAKS